MNKRIKIIIFTVFICLSVYAETNYIFYPKMILSIVDNRNGKELSDINEFVDFNNNSFISNVSIRIDRNKNYNIEYIGFFDNGFLIKSIFDGHIYNETKYFYDDKNRLIKVGSTNEYKYINDNVRDLFVDDNFYQREIINSSNNKTEYIIQDYRNKEQILQTSKIRTYYYNENGKIEKVEEKTWYFGHLSDKILNIDFYYNQNDLLIKVIYHYGDDDIRNIYTIEYDDNNYITRINNFDPSDSKKVRYTIFYDYDKYDNWRVSEEYIDNQLFKKIVREINYLE